MHGCGRGASWLQQGAAYAAPLPRCPAVAEHTPWTWLLLLLSELGCGEQAVWG